MMHVRGCEWSERDLADLCGLAYAHSNSSRDFLSVVSVLTRSSPTTTVDNIIENVRNPAAHPQPIDRAAIITAPHPPRRAVLFPERLVEWRTPLSQFLTMPSTQHHAS